MLMLPVSLAFTSVFRRQSTAFGLQYVGRSNLSLFGKGSTKKPSGTIRHDFSKYADKDDDSDTSIDISIKGLDHLAAQHFGSAVASKQRARREIVIKSAKASTKQNHNNNREGWNNSPVLAVYHKPVGMQSTMRDEWGRDNLGKLLHNWPFGKSMHPVGRLDADSSGLLLFSSDGGITQALLSPRTQVEREYLATVVGNVDEGRLRAALRGGIETSEGSFTADLLSSHILEVDALNTALELVRGSQRERYDKMVLKHKSSPGTSSSQSVTASSSSGAYSKVSKPKISLSGLDSSMLTKPAPEDLSDKVDLSSFDAFLTCQGLTSASLVRLVVREGKYRMVRRMLHNAGHSVVALHRTRYGDVVLGDLPENQLRPIFPDELKWAREAAAKYRKVMRSEGREGKSDSKKNFIPMIAVSNNVNDV